MLVYMAHPVSRMNGYSFEDNIRNALGWYRFLRELDQKSMNILLGQPRERVTRRHLKRSDSKEEVVVLEKLFAQLPTIIAPWLVDVRPDGETPGGRDKALVDCCEVVTRCDEVWLVGGFVSDGMLREAIQAKYSRDLTWWGREPPGEITAKDYVI